MGDENKSLPERIIESGKSVVEIAAMIAVALLAAACGNVTQSGTSKAAGTAVPAAAPIRVPGLPDASFEARPSEWQLGPNAKIDNQIAHGGTRSLRVQLDHGLGSMQVTRSAYLADVDVGPEYVVTFHYRYQNCKSAIFTLAIGDHEKKLALEGTDPKWTQGSIVVSFTKKPAWVDVTAGRRGAADQYAGPQYDDNVLWLDDLEIKPR